ncbi:hypothetical protein CVS54_00043 [Microbacterium oxydans]|uniref:Uncharacterized protein n=1 Tax=Microbacterium oxydans TaxID=82380 RepID=A0A3Q9J1J7_9MICO|nr:hypothetical protein CVS54_00043 [Microbacterium oxydans]
MRCSFRRTAATSAVAAVRVRSPIGTSSDMCVRSRAQSASSSSGHAPTHETTSISGCAAGRLSSVPAGRGRSTTCRLSRIPTRSPSDCANETPASEYVSVRTSVAVPRTASRTARSRARAIPRRRKRSRTAISTSAGSPGCTWASAAPTGTPPISASNSTDLRVGCGFWNCRRVASSLRDHTFRRPAAYPPLRMPFHWFNSAVFCGSTCVMRISIEGRDALGSGSDGASPRLPRGWADRSTRGLPAASDRVGAGPVPDDEVVSDEWI